MSKLVMIAGNSGSGKTFLINSINSFSNEFKVIQKKTTRLPRNSENVAETIELLFGQRDEEVKTCDYVYSFRGEYYGFNACDIDQAFSEEKNPLMVVRHVDCIKMLAQQYYPNTLSICCISTFERKCIRTYLRRKGLSDEEICQRINEEFEAELEKEYLENIGVFDFILTNNYDESFFADFIKLINEPI